MNSRTKDRASVYEWYLPDLELVKFAEKKINEKVTEYTRENQRRIFLQWTEDAYEDLEKNLEYGSLLLSFFVDSLADNKERALFELGSLKGVVASFEHLLYEKGEELRLIEAKRSVFSTVKHLDEVVFALETHGNMTQSELCSYLQGMNASTLSEAMKKILATGLVTVTAMGKYRIYTLTDTGLKYGKMVRRSNEMLDLPRVLKLLQTIIAHTPLGKERKNLAEKVETLFMNGEVDARTDKQNSDIVNNKFEDRLKNVAPLVPKTGYLPYMEMNDRGSDRATKRGAVKRQNLFGRYSDAGLNTLRSDNGSEGWGSNMSREFPLNYY